MGFPKYVKEDYGQTLGAWGVGPGCYLVLPVLGPSTIRDTAGSFANVLGGDPWYNASIHGNNEFLNEGVFLASKALGGIEFRANNIESLFQGSPTNTLAKDPAVSLIVDGPKTGRTKSQPVPTPQAPKV